MEREINRLNDLIEDLLRLSRLDQGGVVLDLKSVELNTLTSQFITEHTPWPRAES
jgi:signal transduction histidine kinase